MDRLLINYLPPVLRDVPELKAIMAAEQPELEQLWSTQDGVLENQFLVSATEYGVKRWERILQIYPKDTDGLEMRRARVLAILRLKLPYTIRWLRQWLDDLCGPGNYGLEVVAYTIALNLGYDTIPEAEKLVQDIMTMLQAAKPANMVLELNAMRQSQKGKFALASVAVTALTMEVWPGVEQLESTGGAVVAGHTAYLLSLDAYPEIEEV